MNIESYYQGYFRFWEELGKSLSYPETEWETPNSCILETPNIKLLRFSKGKGDPIFIIPPNAGHHSNIADRLIQLSILSGRSIYAIEWLSATWEEEKRDYTIEDMLKDQQLCYEKIGRPVHIFSLCQGAWLTAISISLNPEAALSYTNAAGPIDFHSEDGKIDRWTRDTPMEFYETMVKANGGLQLGEYQILGFKSMNPYERWFGDYADLLLHCMRGDEQSIEKWHRFKLWYEYPVNISGKWYLWAIENLFKNNLLIEDALTIQGEDVRLANITCPVNLIAGKTDDVTLPSQVFNMQNKVSSDKVNCQLIDAGHIGVFTSRKSKPVWEKIILNLNSGGI